MIPHRNKTLPNDGNLLVHLQCIHMKPNTRIPDDNKNVPAACFETTIANCDKTYFDSENVNDNNHDSHNTRLSNLISICPIATNVKSSVKSDPFSHSSNIIYEKNICSYFKFDGKLESRAPKSGSTSVNGSSTVSSSRQMWNRRAYKIIALYNKICRSESLSLKLRDLCLNDFDIKSNLVQEVTILNEEVDEEFNFLNSFVSQFLSSKSRSLTCQNLTKSPIRVYVDGVFDLVHSGHFNAFRQAKALGDLLIVGINSDEEVCRVKGAHPIYTESERAEIIRGCKWVDEVIIGTPYSVSLDFLDSLNCDFVAHGDDFVLNSDGNDCYFQPRSVGRLRTFKRTEGISTTTLVSRLLLATRSLVDLVELEFPTTIQKYIENHIKNSNHNRNMQCDFNYIDRNLMDEYVSKYGTLSDNKKLLLKGENASSSFPLYNLRQSLTSTKCLKDFIGKSNHQPGPNDKIVYVDGSFDILHVGHMRILQKAKDLGDYLVVGLHDDATVYRVKGPGFPVMNLLERALSVLALKVVDEVIIGAPWVITEYLIESFKINVVVRGTRIDMCSEENTEDAYYIPKKLMLFTEVESSSTMTTREIIRRIVDNRISLLSTIEERKRKEEKYWKDKESGLNN